MACPQRNSGRAVARCGAFDGGKHAHGRRTAERRSKRVAGHTHAIGEPDQRLTRTGARSDHVGQLQRARWLYIFTAFAGGSIFAQRFIARSEAENRPFVGQLLELGFDLFLAEKGRHQPSPFSAAIFAA